MGSVSAALQGPYAMSGNIAGLAPEKLPFVYFAGESCYNASFFRSASASFISPFGKGVAGISFFRFGDRIYSEQQVSLGYASRIGRYSGGVRVNLLQLNIAEQPVQYTMLVDLGGIAEISEKLIFGAYVQNANAASFSKEDPAVVIIRTGICWKPAEMLRLHVEAEKEVMFRHRIKVGGEYLLKQKLSLRSGVSTNPFKNHFGIGFRHNRFLFEYAMTLHHQLGAEQIIAMAVQLGAK